MVRAHEVALAYISDQRPTKKGQAPCWGGGTCPKASSSGARLPTSRSQERM